MKRQNALIFLSGRALTLVVLLLFQIVVVRVLVPGEYAVYALVFAISTLMQTAVSFGIPRLIPKYVSQAGWLLPFAAVRRLAAYLLLVRVLGSAALMLLVFVLIRGFDWGAAPEWGPAMAGASFAPAALFILASLAQADLDAMAQSLALQRVSRIGSVGEAVVRLVIIGALALAGQISSAMDVLAVLAATACLASAGLLIVVFRALSQPETGLARSVIDWPELRRTALGGYAASMAWFCSSPAVIRLIAGRLLPVATFSGFAFAQGLVMSFQRYTPGSLMMPFVEPGVMREFARSGSRSRLADALSLVVKADVICIGAVIVGVIVAGRPLVEVFTGGRYGDTAFALAWLLTYIATSSVYRSFEVIAIAVGATSALMRPLAISVLWTAVAIAATPVFGLAALLLCPLGDACSRLALMHGYLRREGLRRIIDARVMLIAVGAATLLGIAGSAVEALFGLGAAGTIVTGIFCGLGFLACLAIARPLSRGEAVLLRMLSRGSLRRIVSRLTGR